MERTRSTLARAFFLTISLGAASSAAREFETEIIVDSVEDLYAYEDRGDVNQDDVEALSVFLLRPLDINRAERNVLFELPGVTQSLADSIVRHRSKNGNFRRVDDLEKVSGMQDVILTQIRPFVVVHEGESRSSGSLAEEIGLSGFLRSGVQFRKGFAPFFDALEREIDELLEREHGPQAFLQFEGTALTHFGAGGTLSYRRGIDIEWDRNFLDRGLFVSRNGPNDRVRFDHLYLTSSYRGVDVVLGSFTAGFGERLTFNTSRFQLPSGWYANNVITEDNERSRVRPRARQFGAAVSYNGILFGSEAWLEATVFASSNILDLFQRDFGYEGNNVPCNSANTQFGYSCNPSTTDDLSQLTGLDLTADFVRDGRFRNTRIYDRFVLDEDGEPVTYDFEQLRGAYREDLVGGNLTLHFNDRVAWGVTSYVGQTDFRYDDGARANFAYSAPLPRLELQSYGAIGMHVRWTNPDFDIGAEFARTFVDGGGNGFVLRANVSPVAWLDAAALLRYYGPMFVNPRGNAASGADEVFGERDRNERGARLQLIIRPLPDLRLRSTVDYWQNPDQIFLTEDGYETFSRETPLDDLRLDQRIEYGVTGTEDVFVGVEFTNRLVASQDIERFSFSEGGDTCQSLTRELTSGPNAGLRVSDCALGTRLRYRVGFKTERIPLTTLYVRGEYTRQDDNLVVADFDLGDGDPNQKARALRLVLRARVKPWESATFIGNITLLPNAAFGLLPQDEMRAELVIVDGEPRRNAYIEFTQNINRTWFIAARYGFQDYARDDPENANDVGRYRYYNQLRLKVQYRF